MSAYSNVMIGVKRVSTCHQSRTERYYLYMSQVGLSDSMNKYPAKCRRYAAACGYCPCDCSETEMLLSTSRLSPGLLTRMELQDVILSILDREKITTDGTHDPDEAVTCQTVSHDDQRPTRARVVKS